jgi:uncharacterized DUF497 family protein
VGDIYFLDWDDDNESHLARHTITQSEVFQVLANRYLTLPNPKGRPDTRRLIGTTHGGRIITIVVAPVAHDPATVRPITGWDTTTDELKLYDRYCR